MDNGELTPREKDLVRRFREQGGQVFPGAEKYIVAQMREERDAARWVVTKKATEFTPQRTDWLWRDRIPLGELTLMAGRGNVGKSTVLAQQTAWITTGRMKGLYYGHPKPVIYVVNEDSISKTVLPRMIAAGADISLVYFLEMHTVNGQTGLELPRDGERIRDLIDATGAVAVFIDPLSANVDGDTNKQKEMRRSFQAVRKIAEDMDIAIVGLAHLKKALTTSLVEAIIGSSEQGNVARAVLGVVADPDTEHAFILSQEKSNLGPTDMPSFRYRLVTEYIDGSGGERIRTSRLEWLEETDTTVSDVLADQVLGQGNTSEAIEWLHDFLEQEGPTARREVIGAARKEGFSQSAIERAKSRLKIRSVRSAVRGGAATWSLPVPGHTESPDQD